jgi:SnoaL-like domain
MALERSQELERIHGEMMQAYERRDIEALRRTLSPHPAFVMRGTAPDEIATNHDDALAFADDSADDFPSLGTSTVEAYTDGDLGYIYTEGSFITSDGAEYPVRTLAITHREDGEWRVVHTLNAIPVPNELLTPDSPFNAKRTTAT